MSNLDKQASLSETLNLDADHKPQHYKKLFIIVFIVLLIAGGAVKLLFFKSTEDKTAKFETAQVKHGDLTIAVTATGVLQPVTQVDIGIEVSGTVAELKADFNDHVKAGQVLAVLDLRKLSSQVKQDEGALAQAKAKLMDAEATLTQTQKALDYIRKVQQLSGGQLPAKQDTITAEGNLQRADAQKKYILGQITQAEGQLKFDSVNLGKASIKTPIDGIVLNRKIELGQTVAASLQTPVMFTVAKNLTEMELHVNVDEADVGKIKMGQAASFTVDAYPDKNFPAKISEIRYAPITVNGVVTYETILLVNNEQLLLRPGMTATAEIIAQKLTNVLLVPSAALRFKPADKKDRKKEQSFLDKLLPHTSMPNTPKRGTKTSDKKKHPKVWMLENNKPVPVPVKAGLSDGEMTEVSSEHLQDGMSVIIDTASVPK